MALDDLELHALDLVMEEAVERHLEGYEGPGDKADRWRFKAEGGVVVGRDEFDVILSPLELLRRRQLTYNASLGEFALGNRRLLP